MTLEQPKIIYIKAENKSVSFNKEHLIIHSSLIKNILEYDDNDTITLHESIKGHPIKYETVKLFKEWVDFYKNKQPKPIPKPMDRDHGIYSYSYDDKAEHTFLREFAKKIDSYLITMRMIHLGIYLGCYNDDTGFMYYMCAHMSTIIRKNNADENYKMHCEAVRLDRTR